MRTFLRTSALAAVALLCGAAITVAQQFGTAAEAKAMLDKAAAALKANETEAVAKFNDKAGGFRDRDLYVFCYDVSDGKFTAHPNPALMVTDVRALNVKDDPLGQKIFDQTKEGAVTSVNYNIPARNHRSGCQGIVLDASRRPGLRRRLLQIAAAKL